MKNYYFLIIGVLVLIFVGVFVFAQELSGVTFPIPELGNCKSRSDCEIYCDKPENMLACLDFAEAQGLIPQKDIEMARKMLELGETAGPGGCQGHIQCAAYCDEISHIKECITFAEEHGLIPPEELENAKKVIAAMEKGLTPPNCKNKSECDVYCQEPEHMEECITFGEAVGLIPPEELGDARKTLEAVKKGVKPPACAGKEACDAYCAMEEHFKECINFAEAAGFMSPEEVAMAKRTGGKGPGGCRGKEVCDAFCEDPANMEACISFGLEYGFMPPEEAENAKKTLEALKKGLTPPNCKGAECEAYCNEIAHMEECLLFADAAGLIPPENLEETKKIIEAIKKGAHMLPCRNKEECNVYCSQPENMEECINSSVAAGNMTPEDAEQAKRAAKAGPRPGNCQSEEECKDYCEDPTHNQECMDYAVRAGFMSPEEAQQMQQQMMQMQQIQQMQPPREGGMMPPEGMPPEGVPPEGIRPEGITPFPEGMMPREITPPTQELLPPPPPSEEVPPQSFLDKVQFFLASIISAFSLR